MHLPCFDLVVQSALRSLLSFLKLLADPSVGSLPLHLTLGYCLKSLQVVVWQVEHPDVYWQLDLVYDY
ncbi:hypothetical protein D3C80_1760020 [compost metagenome]